MSRSGSAIFQLRHVWSGVMEIEEKRWRTIGYSTQVGAVLFPISMISSIHSLCDWTLSVERPMILTFRLTNSGSLHTVKVRTGQRLRVGSYLWDMSASSVVHTGVKSPGCEKSITCEIDARSSVLGFGVWRLNLTHPWRTCPFVKLYYTLGSISFEVWCNTSQTEAGHCSCTKSSEGWSLGTRRR